MKRTGSRPFVTEQHLQAAILHAGRDPRADKSGTASRLRDGITVYVLYPSSECCPVGLQVTEANLLAHADHAYRILRNAVCLFSWPRRHTWQIIEKMTAPDQRGHPVFHTCKCWEDQGSIGYG